MDENLFKILLGVISILLTVLTGIIVPYIKEKIGNEKLAKYEYWVDFAVRAAEMIFAEQGMGETKKEYVVAFLNEMFNKNRTVITEEQLNILVEAAVNAMKSSEIKLEQII
jgi:LL-H family phage holin